MSYKLNKTNGDLLVDLVDGQIDNTSTDITLVGRNYKGFGEFLNENFIRLLENFSKTSAPGSPLVGQLWYDTAEERLKVYTGESFRSAAGAIVSQDRPNLSTGDFWIDSLDNKLYFFDGSDLVLVGPSYTASQGKTGFEGASLTDDVGQDQTVIYAYIGGTLVGIMSNVEFRPRNTISGYPLDLDDTRTPKRQIIKRGFNPANTEFWFRGTSQSTERLINSITGEEFADTSFMKTDRNTETSGSINIKNANGLSVGVSDTQYATLKIREGFVTSLELQRSDRDFSIRTRRGNTFDTPMYIDSSERRIGILNTSPQYTLDVTGSGRFTGNLEVDGNVKVNGETTYLNVSTLRVEDKNIELGLLDDSTQGNDIDIDGSGIIVRSSDGSKDLLWIQSTGSWTSNQSFNLEENNSYKINGVTKLSTDRLDNSVRFAEGIVSLGTLTDLDVGTLSIDNNSGITTTTPMFINSNGTITISDVRITGVLNPINAKDVANKQWTEEKLSSQAVAMPLDVTSLSNPVVDFSLGGPYLDVRDILEYLHPANTKSENTIARIFASSFSNAVVTGIDISSGTSKSYLQVFVDPDDSTTPQLESVVQDINFSPVSANANLTLTRAKMEFRIVGGTWVWQNTDPVV